MKQTYRSFLTKGLLAAFLVSGLALPSFSLQAATLSQSQIQSIISLLQAFGADPGTITNVQLALNSSGGTSSTAGNCITLNSNLSLGATDTATQGEVSKLQEFLGEQPTGYFGPTTLQLVENWQTTHNIVSSGTPNTTGWGTVGTRTRAALSCNIEESTWSGSANLSVLPTSGTAPLMITANLTINPSQPCTATNGSINFGDNSPASTVPVPALCQTLQQSVNHTYTTAGNYLITLQVGSASSNSIPISVAPSSSQSCPFTPAPSCPSGTYQPYAYNSQGCITGYMCTTPIVPITPPCPSGYSGMYPNCTLPPLQNFIFSASPTSGTAPLAVSFNYSDTSQGHTYTAAFGDGQSGTLQNACFFMGLSNSGGCTTISVMHTYSSSGVYSAQLLNSANTTLATTTITVTAPSTGGIGLFASSSNTFVIPASVVLSPGQGSVDQNSSNTLTLTLNQIEIAQTQAYGSSPFATAADITVSLSYCGSQMCLGAVSPQPAHATLALNQPQTILGHTFVLTSLTLTAATISITQ